jgi:hypothetical protein
MRLRISPLDLRQLEFYEIEYLLQELEEFTEEENKRAKNQEKDYQKQASTSYKKPSAGKTDYGGFKTPKLDVPKMSMPSMPKLKF